MSAWLIASLSRGHHYVAATNLAAEASQIHPTSALVRISTGRLLIDQYRFEESVPYFQEAYTLDRDDPRALRWLLHGLRQTRRFDEVDTVATTIGLTADPPRIEYARSLLDRYQFKRALAELDLVAATPAEVAALQVRLEALRGLRRLAEAERLAHDAIGEREDDPRPWLELGHVFHEGHRHEDALVAFERAHTIDPSSADALEWRTTELRRLRRWDDAERSAHDAIARRPDAPLLYVELSYLHEDQHLFERAMAAVEQALAIDPRLVPALSQRIDVLRQLRRLDHAEQAALQAIDVRPDSTVLRLALGYVYDEQRDCERALTAAEQALAIDPRYVWAITGRITQLRQLRRFEEAEQAAREAINDRPDSPEPYLQLSYIYDDQCDYERALTAVEQALTIDPRHESALGWRILGLRRLRRFEEAEQAARTAADARPDSPAPYLHLSYIYDEQRDCERALTAAEQALAIDPRYVWAITGRITQLRQLRRFEEAEQAAREAINDRPDSPEPYLQLSYIYDDQYDYERALTAVEQALTIDPRHEWAQAWRVTELRQLRRFEEAEQAARTAADARPNSPDPYLQLSYIYEDQHDYERGLASAEQALAIDPRHESALGWRIFGLRRLRRFEEAEQAARTAADARPNSPDPYLQLSYIYDDQFDYERALTAVEQALTIDPRHEWARVWRITELRQLRRFQEAEQAAREAIDDHPDSPALHVEASAVHRDRHDDEQALAAVEQALTIDPRHEWALVWRVSGLRRLRRYNDAEQAAREAIERRPQTPALYLQLSYLYDDQYDYERALTAAEQALAIDPRHQWAQAWRITELRQLRRLDEAERAAREAIDARSDSPALRLELASVAEDRGQYRQALDCVQGALALDARNDTALTARIRLLRLSHDLAGALATAAKAVDTRPDSVDLLSELGQVHVARHEHQKALAVFDQALALDPGHVQVVERRVNVLQQLLRHSDAEQAAQMALRLRPSDQTLHLSLGRVFEDRLQTRQALACYEEAGRYSAADPRVLVRQSTALRALRSYAEAERLIALLVREQPHLRELEVELARIQHDSDRLSASRSTFGRLERTALSDEERAASIAGLGWVEFTSGDYVAAEEQFGRAVELMPHDREYRLGRAWALVRQDERVQWEQAEQICFALVDEQVDAAALVCLGVIDYRFGRLPAAEYHLTRALEVDPYRGSHTDLAALYTQLGRYDEAETHLRIAVAQDAHNAPAHVELGHLRLLTEEPQEAARLFRGVLRTDPSVQEAALGLAEALTALGQSREAEDVLREGLSKAAVPWRLHLALARLLFHQADATQNDDVFAEAYAEAIEAIKGVPAGEPDPYYVAAVCKARLGGISSVGAVGDAHSRRQALQHLRRCLKIDEGHVDAQRVVQLLERESRTARSAALGTATVAAVALGLLSVMWTAFFLSNRVTVVMITTITPILVGLVAVAVLLPSLVRLKLPGFEADLQAGLGPITSGPTGDVAIRPGNLAISAGPVGYPHNQRRWEYRERR
ncbi:tetratricopeptide repeat protein [Micromonospora sp. WMMD964]|uniref:tetratricopeptide repeat protein n=1 Tax=Micromonospora sp. WMMD964 TaxID=3016091 RepID=UPI00249C8D99|nr:tetratricopeptide repeat protein [Micromonospora sp. WMMD964]WFE98582.1 tetratricopeptide repeat protein [Micromonospora sp. WMMD964]